MLSTECKVQSNVGFASLNGPRKRFEVTVYLYIGKVKKWGVWISAPETEVPEVFEEIAGWPEGCWGRVKKGCGRRWSEKVIDSQVVKGLNAVINIYRVYIYDIFNSLQCQVSFPKKYLKW